MFAPLLDTSDEDWSRILQVNLTGPFICTKAAAPLMREHGGGAIVNITSISAVRASTLRSAYGTSKAGLAHLTKQLAVELASLGIRVNAVAPGPVETAMAKQVHTPEIRADYHDAIPLNRYGLEEELAEAIFFLCSDRSSYITGQILAVDGGFDAAGIGLPTLRGAAAERLIPRRVGERSVPTISRHHRCKWWARRSAPLPTYKSIHRNHAPAVLEPVDARQRQRIDHEAQRVSGARSSAMASTARMVPECTTRIASPAGSRREASARARDLIDKTFAAGWPVAGG